MPLVGEPVPYGNPGVARELLHDVLVEAAELDAVVERAEHVRGVGDALFATEVRSLGSEVGDVGALVIGRDLEGRSGAGRVLLEYQRDVLAGEMRLLLTGALRCTQLACGVHQPEELVAIQVDLFQQRADASLRSHRLAPFAFGSIGSRRIGQLMQRAPPRPRPSSSPDSVMTSMPLRLSIVLVSTLRS